MNQPQIPPHVRIWQLSLGFANTMVLHALIKTGVIEQMREQPRRVPELARACGLNADVLYRTLRFAAAIDVVAHDGEQYTLTEVGRLLLKDVPRNLRRALLLVGSEPWQKPWQNLAHALATGEAAFDNAMGAGFFEYLNRHPEYAAPYNEWMTIATALTAQAIVAAYDFSPFETVCDVGGGQGVLLKRILTANPHLRGILYDQESVVRDHVLADLGQRAEVQSGSFFERVPAANALLLKSVLHDWNDEKCRIILARCRDAMRPSDRLLIVELVIASPADHMGAFYDLHMQVLLGGRERTEDEFRSLLEAAGMKLRRIVPTESPMKIVEASV